MIGQETLLKNFVGGSWEAAAASQTIPVRNPATGDVIAEAPLSGAADVAKAVQAASKALPAWRRTPAGDRIQPLFRLKALLDAHFSEIAQADHAGMRQDARRVGRRAAARHRERRGRHRHPVADDGQQPRGHRLGHRRADDPPAGRRRRRHHAVQLPRHDPALVPALRRRLRQHGRPQAVGEDAADDGARAAAGRAGRLPARRRQPRARRQGRGRRAARSSRTCGRSRSSARRRSRATSTAAPRPTASACSARAAPRTRSSSCPTPTWT